MNPTQAPDSTPEELRPTSRKPLTETQFALRVLIWSVVIALLLALAFVAARLKTRPLAAKATMKGLEIAIKGYKTEYLRLPFPGPAQPTADNPPYSTDDADGNALLEVLLDLNPVQNPRHIRFWNPGGGGGRYTPGTGLTDPLNGKAYHLILDYDDDGRIADPEHPGATISADVILYSAGPDGDFTTWGDNVRSWK